MSELEYQQLPKEAPDITCAPPVSVLLGIEADPVYSLSVSPGACTS